MFTCETGVEHAKYRESNPGFVCAVRTYGRAYAPWSMRWTFFTAQPVVECRTNCDLVAFGT